MMNQIKSDFSYNTRPTSVAFRGVIDQRKNVKIGKNRRMTSEYSTYTMHFNAYTTIIFHR